MKQNPAPMSLASRCKIAFGGNEGMQNPWVEKEARKGGAVWVARWYVKDATGKVVKTPKRVVGACKRMSKAEATIKAAELAKGEMSVAPAPTATSWTWLRLRETIEPLLAQRWRSANSRAALTNRLDHAPWEDRPIEEIRKMDIQQLALDLEQKHSASTVAAIISAIRTVFAEAVDNELIARNPAAKITVEIPAGQKTKLLTLEEYARVMAAPGSEGLFVRMSACCGLRRGEVIALRRKDLNDRMITVDETEVCGKIQAYPKGKRPRTVACPPQLWRDLAALIETSPYQAPEAFVFHREDGVHLSTTKVDGMHKPDSIMSTVRIAVKIPDLTLRMCRHAYATYIKGDAADIQAALGHARLETTLGHYRESQMDRMKGSADELESTFTKAEGSVN